MRRRSWRSRGSRARSSRERALPAEVQPVREMTVFTHRRVDDTAEGLRRLAQLAADAGVTLRLDEEETRKHRLPSGPGVLADAPAADDVELCLVLGGDGTIWRALQRYAGTRVPVFAINFGEIGFLATIEPREIEEGMRRALKRDFELLRLPAIVLQDEDGAAQAGTGEGAAATELATNARLAINDVAIHRKAGERVAEIALALDEEVVGSVRCDGLVVATPAGSTGYNLANGGPVMAWGVEGFVVSFIAPHSLTGRAPVTAPTDRLIIHNASKEEPVEVGIDGRPVYALAPAE